MIGRFEYIGKTDKDFTHGETYMLNIDQYQDGIEITSPRNRLYPSNAQFYQQWHSVGGRIRQISKHGLIWKILNKLGRK